MAARFAVAAGNWSATSTWSTTSGGASGAAVPTSSDDVTLDSNTPNGTVTIDVAANANTITINKSGVTLLHNAGSTVVGAVTLTTGTLNTNGQTCSWGALSSNNSNARTLTFGASAITATAAPCWSLNVQTNAVITANTAIITFTNAAPAPVCGAINWNGASFVLSAVSGNGTINMGNSTMANLTVTASGKVGTCQLNTALTITGILTLSGPSATSRLLAFTSATGTQRTVTVNGSFSLSNADFMDIASAGTAGTWTGTSLGDCQGNSGITFDAPATQTYTDTGSHADNWSTLARWTSRVPLPQDNVLVPLGSTGTITADMPRLGKDIDFTGYTGTAAFSSVGNSIFGSPKLATGMTVSGTQILTLAGRGAQTITSATKTWTMRFVINAPGGTYTLQDTWSGNNTAANTTLNLQNGTLTDNGQTVTVGVSQTGGSFVMSGGVLNKTGTWNFSATAAVSFWQVTGGTVNDTSGAIVLTNASANTRTFAGGGKSYATLTDIIAGSTGALVITGANTFAKVNFSDVTNARTLTLPASTITTILDASGIVGTSGKNMTINSSSPGTQATLTEVGLIQTFLTITDLLINVQGAATGDTTSDADAVTLLALGTLGNQTDAVGIADAPSLLALFGPADTTTGTDTATSVGLSDGDTASTVDAPTIIGLSQVDNPLTLADLATTIALAGIGEPVAVTEMARLFDFLNVYETIGVADNVSSAALFAGDTISLGDLVGTLALTVSLSELVAILEATDIFAVNPFPGVSGGQFQPLGAITATPIRAAQAQPLPVITAVPRP